MFRRCGTNHLVTHVFRCVGSCAEKRLRRFGRPVRCQTKVSGTWPEQMIVLKMTYRTNRTIMSAAQASAITVVATASLNTQAFDGTFWCPDNSFARSV